MEEKIKRSNRRYHTYSAVVRRIKKWLIQEPEEYFDLHEFDEKGQVVSNLKIHSNAEKIQRVFDGKCFQFLRTTGNPCNCPVCSEMNKYRTFRAKENEKVRQEIEDQLDE